MYDVEGYSGHIRPLKDKKGLGPNSSWYAICILHKHGRPVKPVTSYNGRSADVERSTWKDLLGKINVERSTRKDQSGKINVQRSTYKDQHGKINVEKINVENQRRKINVERSAWKDQRRKINVERSTGKQINWGKIHELLINRIFFLTYFTLLNEFL